MGGFAWVTLATNDSYSLGALVLAHSLKQAGTTQQLAVLVTPGVTNAMREKLGQVFNLVQEVNILDSKDEANLRLLKRPELGITFTKLHCWRLTQYDKCVFLDADTLVLQNCDELFEREELSAAPDVGWPDCFNSGVFVYRPSNETYEKLIQFALEKGSFDGGDQGLLNLYFSDWAHKDISKHLPFIYNLCSTACYSYLPAFKQFGGNAKIIHFIGTTKPWLQYFNTETRQVQPSSDSGHLKDVLQRWWDIFCSLIHPNLSPDMNRSGTDNVHTHGSPSQIPYCAPTCEFENISSPIPADDYQNVWDPWDEYDKKQANIQTTPQFFLQSQPETNQPFESLNTNACSREAGQEHVYQHQSDGDKYVQSIPYVQSQPHSISCQHSNPPPYQHKPEQSYHTEYSESPFHHHQSHDSHTAHQIPFDQTIHSEQTHHKHAEIQKHHTHNDPANIQAHHESIETHNSLIHDTPNIQSHHERIEVYSPPPVHNISTHEFSENVQSHFNKLSHSEIHCHNEPTQTLSYHEPYHENSKLTPAHDSTPCQPNSDPEYSQPTSHPILPKECEVTRTNSNDTSLYSSTNEDSSSKNDAGLAGAFAQLILGVPRTAEQEALESHLRRQAWEVGNIDYLGRDSFENIWSKILDTLSRAPESEDTPASEPAAPTEQPKAPTTPSATEAKLPEPQSVPLQPETTAEQKQEETKQTETTAPALVSIPLESPKPEATPDQPASTAPQQTPVTEEPISQPQAAPESPAQPSDETLAPAAQELPTPVQDLPAQLAQEPPAQPTQEPPTQVQEPPVQVQELPAQPAQEPAAQVQEPPKQVQETPAQVQEAPAQVQELLAQPAQEHPAQLPQESSTQPQEPVSPVVEAEPSAAIQEKPSDEVAAEVIKSEPVTECAKVDITSAAASAETKTPEIPEPITETPPEPTPIPKSDGTKQEPVTTLPESPVEVPKATAAQPSKTSEASSVPETSPVQSLESPKIPDPVSAPEPATAAESTKLSESPVCPLKLETPKSPEEPKTPKATPAPTGELPKAEALAQVPEPKTPEAPVCPKKSTELATPKAATKATPPSTPAVEQAKEATESDTAQSQPPVEAAAVSQPQAPPRKVVKKTTKKAK